MSFFYVQPERVEPPDPRNPDYDVRADVWSLGISLVSPFLIVWQNVQKCSRKLVEVTFRTFWHVWTDIKHKFCPSCNEVLRFFIQVELAIGYFPYTNCSSEFEVLMKIMHDPAPSLPPNQGFSEEFQSFINVCLEKDMVKRPKFDLLLVSYMYAVLKF